MPFCASCGTQLLTGAKFCPSCGTPCAPSAASAADGSRPTVSRSATAQVRSPAASAGPQSSGQGRSLYTAENASVEAKLSPIVDDLKRLYKTKILPLEQAYKFEEFHSPALTDTDFDARPMVLLLGQYSTGKTTFIKYLLERDFPGAHIGPEPTTDRFVAVMHGKDERTIPGNALAADASRPFTALNKFGMAFLNKFECSQCDAPILEKLTFIDTPGVLSGEKQRIGRSYNFPEVIEWFAERADRILLLFDAHKLDISDEFKGAIEALRGHDDKIKVVLNKADLEMQHLMRVYGALMWSLGKVIKTPEVLRVYIGSFWDGPLIHTDNARLLRAEQEDLLSDLRALPRNSTIRKINELVKRARMCKVHAHIISHLRNQFGMFGKEKTQKKLLSGLGAEFKKVQQETNLPMGDFPHVQRFTETLSRYEVHKFPKIDPKLIKNMDDVLGYDIPRLMKELPGAEALMKAAVANQRAAEGIPTQEENPFAVAPEDEQPTTGWAITRAMKNRYDNEFFALDLTQDNKVSGANAKKVLLKSKLEPKTLKVIWDLSDIDKDGQLDHEEFAVAMYLIDQLNTGSMAELPDTLPHDIMPPNKRLELAKAAASGAGSAGDATHRDSQVRPTPGE